MLYILGNRHLMECQTLEDTIPKEVLEHAESLLEILEDNYNCGNMPFVDGGYVALLSDNQKDVYQRFLNQYNLVPELTEYKGFIVEENGMVWYQEYYQIATEYGVVVIFCVPSSEADKRE